MKKLILIFVLICQSFAFATDPKIPTISPESTLSEIVIYYDFVININGEISSNKLDVFRQALSKYSAIEIIDSGLLEKAYKVSSDEYERILSQSRDSNINFFNKSTVSELTKIALQTPVERFDGLLDRSSDYYRALDDLDPRGQTRKHNVIKIIQALSDTAEQIKNTYNSDLMGILVGKTSEERKKEIFASQKTVSDIKHRAFKLFSRFKTFEQAELLSKILTRINLEQSPKKVVSALTNSKNESAKALKLVSDYFNDSARVEIGDNELWLISYYINKNPEDMANLFAKKKELFLSYLKVMITALEEEHGYVDHYYDSYVMSELQNTADTIAKLAEHNEDLIFTYFDSIGENSNYNEFEHPIQSKVVFNLIRSKAELKKPFVYYLMESYESGKYGYSNKQKYSMIKLLKEQGKLPRIQLIKDTRFYQELLESRYYKIKLWLLSSGCNKLFKK